MIPTSSRVSCTSVESPQRQNLPPPSSVRWAISAIYPIDLLLRYVSSRKSNNVREWAKSPISAMIFGNVVSTFVSSSSPLNANIFTPVLVEDLLTSSCVSIVCKIGNTQVVYQVLWILATFFLLFFSFWYTFDMKYGIIQSSEIEQSALSFWQSTIWSEIILSSWQAKESFYYGNINSTFLHIEIRSIGLGFFGAFAIGVSAEQVSIDWDTCVSHLQIFLRSKEILFLQIEPIEELCINIPIKNKIYKKFLTPYTRTINITQSEDEILSQMHEKWRYNIRSAIKKWVQIEQVICSQENLDTWMNLLNETLLRDWFAGNSWKYYENFITGIQRWDHWWLYFAQFEDRIIAAGIFVFMPSCAIYYYGASSSDSYDKKVFAPYLLQWEVMKIAKNKKIPSYDFLWVSQPWIENDSLAWVSFFKSRFGGKIVELPQKILFPLTWKYNIFIVLQKIKNLLVRR